MNLLINCNTKQIPLPDRSKMETTVLNYMDESEEESVVHRINRLKYEIKALYNITCMI